MEKQTDSPMAKAVSVAVALDLLPGGVKVAPLDLVSPREQSTARATVQVETVVPVPETAWLEALEQFQASLQAACVTAYEDAMGQELTEETLEVQVPPEAEHHG